MRRVSDCSSLVNSDVRPTVRTIGGEIVQEGADLVPVQTKPLLVLPCSHLQNCNTGTYPSHYECLEQYKGRSRVFQSSFTGVTSVSFCRNGKNTVLSQDHYDHLRRVMLKLSGEALQGGMGFGVDPKVRYDASIGAKIYMSTACKLLPI